MTQTVRIECPHCFTKLNVKNPSIYGKKVRCPKCSRPFVAEAPPADAEPDEFADNLGSMGDDFGEALPSASLPAAPSGQTAATKRPNRAEGRGGAGGPQKKGAAARVRPVAAHLAVASLRTGRRVGGRTDLGSCRLFLPSRGRLHRLGGRRVRGGRPADGGWRPRGIGSGLLAIALSIFVILCCKFTVAYLITVQVMGKMTAPQNDDGVKFILAMSIAKEDAVKNAKGGANGSPTRRWKRPRASRSFPKTFAKKRSYGGRKCRSAKRTHSRSRWDWSGKSRPLFVAAFTFIAMFRWLDILWFLLAPSPHFASPRGQRGVRYPVGPAGRAAHSATHTFS